VRQVLFLFAYYLHYAVIPDLPRFLLYTEIRVLGDAAPMQIRSLAYQTDLFFPRFDGEVVDRGDYTVIRTPSNPTFHWGNFLLFD